jgi:hypothetical protein
MANTQAICTSFKVELLKGHHALGTTVVRAGTTKDNINAALYLASATKNAYGRSFRDQLHAGRRYQHHECNGADLNVNHRALDPISIDPVHDGHVKYRIRLRTALQRNAEQQGYRGLHVRFTNDYSWHLHADDANQRWNDWPSAFELIFSRGTC